MVCAEVKVRYAVRNAGKQSCGYKTQYTPNFLRRGESWGEVLTKLMKGSFFDDIFYLSKPPLYYWICRRTAYLASCSTAFGQPTTPLSPYQDAPVGLPLTATPCWKAWVKWFWAAPSCARQDFENSNLAISAPLHAESKLRERGRDPCRQTNRHRHDLLLLFAPSCEARDA